MTLYVRKCTISIQIIAKCTANTIKFISHSFLNISIFTNGNQRVPYVKEIDKKFQAFFSLSIFLRLIYLIKSLILSITSKNTVCSFHLISRMGSPSNYSLRLSTLSDGGPAP